MDAQVSSADIVDSLVVNHEGAVDVFEGGMCSEDGVVWLDNGRAHSWSGVDCEFELGLLAVIGGESLKEKSTESGTGTTTEGVEDEEACI